MKKVWRYCSSDWLSCNTNFGAQLFNYYRDIAKDVGQCFTSKEVITLYNYNLLLLFIFPNNEKGSDVPSEEPGYSHH